MVYSFLIQLNDLLYLLKKIFFSNSTKKPRGSKSNTKHTQPIHDNHFLFKQCIRLFYLSLNIET